MNFLVCDIDELGPRPSDFPSKNIIDRKEQELKLIYTMLELINEAKVIFTTKDKIRQLYYKPKRHGIREGYIRKISFAKVKQFKVKNHLNYEYQKIIRKMEDIRTRHATHWTILHTMFLQVTLNMILTKHYWHLHPGIYEIVKVKRKRKRFLQDFF